LIRKLIKDLQCVTIEEGRTHKFKDPITKRLYAEEHTTSGAGSARRVIRRGRDASAGLPRGLQGLRRFAFNRNPRAANTPACVPRRYEFIVYTERPLVHIRKLIVPAVNYSACTAATAAASPHVRHRGTSFHGARVHVHKCVAGGRGILTAKKAKGAIKKDVSSDYSGPHSINTHLYFDCGGDNWWFRFRTNPGNLRGKKESFESRGTNFLYVPHSVVCAHVVKGIGESFGIDALRQIEKSTAFDHGHAFMRSAALEYSGH